MERGHFKNKRRYDTPGQTQWCSLRGPRLIPPKSDLNLLQLFSTYFSPREGKKKQEQIQIKWNKLKRIHETTGKKEWKLNGCLRYWPAFLPGRLAHRICTHRFPARADSRAWPCLNTPAGSARRATALQYLLHMPGSVRLREGACIGEKRDGARSPVAIYRVLEFPSPPPPLVPSHTPANW